MSTSKQQLRPKICDVYEVGDFIDAKDSQGDWRVGYIVDKNDMTKTFKVRFDGWSGKYDEYYRFNNPKLKQFRKVVMGYTGQKQHPAMRQGWKFSLQQLENKLLDLHAYITKNSLKNAQNAHNFNQWIRGHNYFYVDFLMTVTFPNLESIHKAIQFFKLNITFSIQYLKYMIENFDKFIQNLQKTNDQHLEDVQVAKSWAFYEIFDMVYTISGNYQRVSQFFKQNEVFLRDQFQIPPSKQIVSGYKLKIVEFFYKKKGFQFLLELLRKTQSQNKAVPFVFLSSLAHLLAGLSLSIQPKLRQSFAIQFQEIILKSLKYLGDKQMKDFNQFEIINCLNEIINLSKNTKIEKQIESWSQLIQMELCLKMILCPFFEKKLRGITSLQQLIEKNVDIKKQEQQLDIIADGTLLKWIQSKNLFDVLFANDNPELIKKSTELIKYLYHRNNEMERYIELVWKYRQGKHQTALKEIYNFMGEIPMYDKNQQFTRILFLKHLSKLQEPLWDSEYFKMIKDYTINALENCTTGNFKQTYGYQMIYNYLLQNQSDETLVNYLIQILDKLKQSQIFQKLITKYFLNIQNNNCPQFHVFLLVKIFKEKIIDVRSIKLDCQQIIQKRIIQTKNSLTQNTQQQFQLLSQYLYQAKQHIPDTDFIEFWNQMVNSKGRAHFFKWLFKVRDSGKVVLTNFIDTKTKKYLMQNFWTDEYLLNNQIDQFEAIFLLQLFKFLNDKQQKIKRTNIVIQILDENLKGLEKIHSVYLNSNDPKTIQILAKGLAQIYYCGGERLAELNIDILGDFIQRIVFLMKDFSETNNLQGVKKMIRLVEQLILRDEQIFDIQQIIRMESFKNIIVKNLQTKQEKIFRFNLLQNVYSIKKIIAQKFNIQLNKFDMVINDDQECITYESYFKSLGQLDIKSKILINLRNEQTSRTKNYLNQYLEFFFEFLGNKAIQQRVWNIVSKLPISNDIRQKIMQSQNSLEIIANKDSFYKQLYMFKVALSIQKKWWSLVLQDLTEFFISRLQKIKGQTQIERQYIVICGKLLQNVIKKEEQKNQKILSECFLHVFNIVKRLLFQINQIQSKNVLNVKKFLQTFFSIGQQLNTYLLKNQLMQKYPDAMSLMLNDPQIQGFFKLCLIEHNHESIRKQFPVKLALLTKNNKGKHAVKLAEIILNDLIDATVIFNTKNPAQFIQYACFILETMDGFLKQFYAQKKTFYFKKLSALIQNQAPQKNIETINMQLQCYLSIIKFVIKEVPADQLEKFFIYLYSECLFKGNLSKCKSKQTRNSVFNILVRFVKYNKNPQIIHSTFSHLQRNGLWRTRRLDDWTIAQTERLKSSTNYVGLRNLGCICYMNSFFQQIFMIQEFRKALLLAEDPEYSPLTIQENLLFQVKKMFMNLMYSDKKAYNPKSFCLSFKDYEGNPTNVSQQMDIDEFSGILFDRIENQLKSTKNSSLIKDTFGGIYSNEIICKGCPHFSESEQSFLSLGLTVKDKKSIYESLQTMIKGETLDGDNAYHCDRCDKKVSAVKRVCLKKLPNYLIIALKRFQFDYNTMTKLKINDYCEFPQNLNLQQYSYQYLRKSQNLKSVQEDQQLKDKKYYEYKLKGVVIHLGYADSGHYYSLIQEPNNEQKWIQFNDSVVRKFNIENLNDQAFGGQTGGSQSKQKIKNAYLLVYERVQKVTSMQNQIDQQQENLKKMEMYSEVVQNIQKQNYQHNVQNVLFSTEYSKFIQSLIDEASRNRGDLQLQKFIVSAILTVILRAKTFSDIFDTLKNFYNSCCKGNNALCEFIVSQFCDVRIFEEFFRSCPIRQIKRNVAVWLGLILREVDYEMKQKFMKVIIYKITKENENNFEALTILHNLVQDDKCLRFMLGYNLIGRLLQNVVRKERRFFGSTQMLDIDLESKQTYLGHQEVIQKTSFQLKKFKYDNQSGYVWAIIYKIINKFPLQQIGSILHPKEIEYLYFSRDKIYKLLQQVKSKFDIDVLTDMLAYFSQQNLDFTTMLIELIEKGLKQFQSKRYRQFFILFHKIINIQDELTQQRITGVYNIVRSLKENQKYAMDCTIIELWLCKIINQNLTLREYLMKQKNILKYLASLPLNKVPSDQLSKKNVNYTDTSVSKLHGIPFPSSRKGYTKILRQVENFYEKLLNNEYQPIHCFEGGNHIVYDKIVPGDQIAYFDVKDKVAFEEALVKEVFSDKILISRKTLPNKLFWIWIDDEKLTSNLKVLKVENQNELDSSKTTQMEDQIDFEAVI